MIKDQRLAAAFGLGPFPGVIDDERVEVRQWAQGQLGVAAAGLANAFTRQPLDVAMFAKVHQYISPEAVSQPEVVGQIRVGGGQIRAVVTEARITVVAP